MACCQHRQAAFLHADDALSLSSRPRQQLCPPGLNPLRFALFLPVHWTNWIDFLLIPNFYLLGFESKMGVLIWMGVAWHPFRDALRMLRWQPVFPCYITAFCSTASTTSYTQALSLCVHRETVDSITEAGRPSAQNTVHFTCWWCCEY